MTVFYVAKSGPDATFTVEITVTWIVARLLH